MRSQDRQFIFDAAGNLVVQTNAVSAPPKILRQPQHQVVEPGEPASFSVVVADTRGLSYQWRFYGTNLTGAVGDAVLIPHTSTTNAGDYSVVVVNSSGSVTSSPAALLLDVDDDYLPDSWEQLYFGGLGQRPTGDFDQDGVVNLDEWLEGTNPTNSASLLFHLTILANGGRVEVTPAKPGYTNGEMVTLTATAFGSEIFHGWTGDVSGTTNPITFSMISNKTVFAHFQPMILTWTNTVSASWNAASNWNPNFVPLFVDDVVLPNNVTISIDADANCRDLALTTGTITGNSNLTIHGNSLWTGGTWAGSGRTIIAPGATFTVSSPFFTMNLARTLENAGTVVWTGSGGLNLNNVAITNRAGALFQAPAALTMSSGGGSPRFDNAGTFHKSSNGGTTTFNIPFNNYGAVDLEMGTLLHNSSFVNNGAVALAAGTTHRIAGGGSANGTFHAPATALVDWFNTFTLSTGALLNGAGIYRVNNALVCDTDLAVQNLEVLNTLAGSGAVTISNTMSWTGGTLSGSGRTIIAPGATLTINSSFFTMNLARTLENAGTVLWTGSGGINVNNVAITNRAGALFQAQTALAMNFGGGSPRFDNAGTFRKSSDGATTFNIPFNDYGLVESLTGTLSLNGGGTHIGSFVVSNGTSLNFGGTHSLSAAASTVGAGNVNVSSGVFTHSGLANITGVNSFSGGTANLNGNYNCTNNTVSISGGVANFNGTGSISPATVNLTGGSLGGSSLVTVLQQMNWTGGSMGGSGQTLIAPEATLTINSSTFTLTLARALENAGTVVWSGVAGMNVNNVAITNRAGALFQSPAALTMSSAGGSPRFDNAGTFRKSTNGGTTTFNIPFNNYGEVDLQLGTILHNGFFVNNGSVILAASTIHRLSAGGSATGTFTNPPTAAVEWFGGNPFTLNTGAQLNGAGLYRINSTLICNPDLGVTNLDLNGTLDGPGIVTIHNVMNWYGGTMSGSGRTVIAPGATLNAASVPFTVNLSSRALENGGTILWTGAGINVNSTFITNRAGALFHAQNATSITGGGASPRFDNAGTFRKSISTGTTFLGGGVPFNNYGTVEVQTGTIYFVSSFLNNGAVTVAGGSALQMAAGGSATGTFTNPPTALVEWLGSTAFTLNTGAQLNGAGLYRINSTLVCNSDLGVTNLDLNGTLDGLGIVTVHNVMNWYGGTMSGSGRTVISPGGTLNVVNSPFAISLNSRSLENGGTILWTGAGINANSALITNRAGALFHAVNGQPISGSGSPRFDNAGTFRKSANAGNTTLSGIPFNNYGTVDLRHGLLLANGGYTSSAGARLNSALGGPTPGAHFGYLQVAGTVTLNGNLSVELTNNFVPSTNSFTLVTAGSRSGTFNNFLYPSNIVMMAMSNAPNSVVVTSIGLATNGPPAFAKDLSDLHLFYAGRVATQSVLVAGSNPLTYQWKRNGTNLLDGGRISGAQSSTLVISNVAVADGTAYQVAVTNAEGFALSSEATVAIQAVPKLNANGAGWALQGTTPPVMTSNSVTLTSGLLNTSRSVFYNAPLYIAAFSASFVYRDVGGGGADGITFCLQNAPGGAATLGGGGGGIGYFGITPSAALVLNIYAPNTVGIALRTNGTLPAPGGYAPTTPVNLASGNPIQVSLLYTGNVLRVTLVDLNTASRFSTNYSIDLSAVLGAETAYVGFTGGDGGVASTQVVSNYTFVPLPSLTVDQPTPATIGLSWPASIGGYTMQSKSNLAAIAEPWHNVANPVTQITNRNRITVTPQFSTDNYRLRINLDE